MLSIKDNDKYEEIIKYSKFISFIFRVYSKNEVNDYIDKIKKEYPNATHYCYGYVIDNDIKSSDDGEPSRTAGAIVVRYFGGVKLGVGPLTRAYGKVAREVIRDNNIITLVKGYDIMITFGYSDIKDIDYILRDSHIISKVFEDNIIYNVLVTSDVLDKLGNYNIKINKDIYIEKE